MKVKEALNMAMMNEEQAHVEFLKERAQFLGLTFDQYMLFLIFETLDHAPALNNEEMTPSPWEGTVPEQNGQF